MKESMDVFVETFNELAIKKFGLDESALYHITNQGLFYDSATEAICFGMGIKEPEDADPIWVQVTGIEFWWEDIDYKELIEKVRCNFGLSKKQAITKLQESGLIEYKTPKVSTNARKGRKKVASENR